MTVRILLLCSLALIWSGCSDDDKTPSQANKCSAEFINAYNAVISGARTLAKLEGFPSASHRDSRRETALTDSNKECLKLQSDNRGISCTAKDRTIGTSDLDELCVAIKDYKTDEDGYRVSKVPVPILQDQIVRETKNNFSVVVKDREVFKKLLEKPTNYIQQGLVRANLPLPNLDNKSQETDGEIRIEPPFCSVHRRTTNYYGFDQQPFVVGSLLEQVSVNSRTIELSLVIRDEYEEGISLICSKPLWNKEFTWQDIQSAMGNSAVVTYALRWPELEAVKPIAVVDGYCSIAVVGDVLSMGLRWSNAEDNIEVMSKDLSNEKLTETQRIRTMVMFKQIIQNEVDRCDEFESKWGEFKCTKAPSDYKGAPYVNKAYEPEKNELSSENIKKFCNEYRSAY